MKNIGADQDRDQSFTSVTEKFSQSEPKKTFHPFKKISHRNFFLRLDEWKKMNLIIGLEKFGAATKIKELMASASDSD